MSILALMGLIIKFMVAVSIVYLITMVVLVILVSIFYGSR